MESLKGFLGRDSLVIDPEIKLYARTACSERVKTVEALRLLYKCIPQYLELTCSGMNAIMMVMAAIVKANPPKMLAGRAMFFADELYCDTRSKVINYLQDNGILIVLFDQKNFEETAEKIKAVQFDYFIIGMFFETCSNPYGKIMDWKILEVLREETTVIVDNTWLSPVVFNPFENLRVDVVVESCTKYISGGTAIAGLVACRERESIMAKAIDYNIRLFGIHISPIHSRILFEEIKSIESRLKSSLKRTKELLEMLGLDPKGPAGPAGSKEPKVPVDPKYTLYNSGLKSDLYPSSIILFEVVISDPKFKSKKFQQHFFDLVTKTGIACETSYGKPKDSICNYVHRTHDKSKLMVRLAVGYNDSLANVSQLFEQMKTIIDSI